MSFVLEALKRSEQQRQVASAPNLGSYVLPSRRGKSRTVVWLGVAFGALLVAVVLLSWWLSKRQPVTAADKPANVVVQQATAAPVPAMPAAVRPPEAPVYVPPQPQNPKLATRQDDAPDRPITSQRPQLTAQPAPALVQPLPPTQPTMAAAPAIAPASPPLTIALPSLSKPKAPEVSADPPANNSTFDYGELPASIRHSLPDLKVSGYMIGEDGRALAAVNDRLVGEGEEVSSGLVVEKIEPNGVVFRYRQYRFRL